MPSCALAHALVHAAGTCARGLWRHRPHRPCLSLWVWLHAQVPEGGPNGASRLQDGTITPKSPYEDSLAALHEIATSPHPYAAANGGASDHNDRRCRLRLSTDVDRVGYSCADVTDAQINRLSGGYGLRWTSLCLGPSLGRDRAPRSREAC